MINVASIIRQGVAKCPCPMSRANCSDVIEVKYRFETGAATTSGLARDFTGPRDMMGFLEKYHVLDHGGFLETVDLHASFEHLEGEA
jgi:hypothetical protein